MDGDTRSDTLTAEGGPDSADFLDRAARILGGDVRPDDYLPVTPEVRAAVDRFMEWGRSRLNGVPPAPEVEPRQLRIEMLARYHPLEDRACLFDENGIVVLALGLERVGEFLRRFPREDQRRGVEIVMPEWWR